MVSVTGNLGLPEQFADQVVLANVVGEEIYTKRTVPVRRQVRILGRVCDLVQLRLPKHVALPHDARSYADSVDSSIKFSMSG